jgi:hypothetical protein
MAYDQVKQAVEDYEYKLFHLWLNE